MPDKLQIAPSVLAADPLNLGAEVRRVLDAGADLLHIDIMDGHFVPNLTYGPGLVKALKKGFPHTAQDVHLMLDEPGKYVDAFAAAGADEITVHVEAAGDIAALLKKIRALGCRAGLSLRPGTETERLKPYLPDCDLILVMSVEPGFGGQKLMEKTLDKLPLLRSWGFEGVLSVDGGVNPETMRAALQKGATRLVMGTAVFGATNPAAVIAEARGLA